MCKVFAVAGIKPKDRHLTEKIMETASKYISEIPDNDGVGYAAITDNCKVFGEKWLSPADAFKLRGGEVPLTDSEKFLDENYTEAIGTSFKKDMKSAYRQFGKQESFDKVTGIILHARNRTKGEISIKNTHPFYEVDQKGRPDVALIHNGTINNHEKLTKKYSTCDSEVILHEWIKERMYFYPEKIEKLAKTLYGEYACLVLSSNWDAETKEYYPILDIFKSRKPLYIGYIKELDTAFFCTKEEIIGKVCKDLNLTCEKTLLLKDDKYIRIDATNGRTYGWIEDFTPNSTLYEYSSNSTTFFPTKTTNDEMNKLKEKFEKNNSEVFGDDYLEVDFTEKELQFFETLKKDPNSNKRALELVEKVILNRRA